MTNKKSVVRNLGYTYNEGAQLPAPEKIESKALSLEELQNDP